MADFVLHEEDALGRGAARLVFQHPELPDRLIKVMRPKAARSQAKRGRLFSHGRRFGMYKIHAKELTYYLECAARAPDNLRLFPALFGFEPTNFGLGLVCEKICDGRGGLAPSLADLCVGGGLEPRHVALLGALEATLEGLHVVAPDLSPGNIVMAGEAGTERLVIVDGIGDPYLPPLRRLSRIFNRYHQRRDFRRLYRMLGLAPDDPEPRLAAACSRP